MAREKEDHVGNTACDKVVSCRTRFFSGTGQRHLRLTRAWAQRHGRGSLARRLRSRRNRDGTEGWANNQAASENCRSPSPLSTAPVLKICFALPSAAFSCPDRRIKY